MEVEGAVSGMTVLFKYIKARDTKEGQTCTWLCSSSVQKVAHGGESLGERFQLNIKCFSENQDCSEVQEATRHFRRGRICLCQQTALHQMESQKSELPRYLPLPHRASVC